MKPALDQIHNLDCIAGMAALDAGSVDLAFADPPFNIGYDYDIYQDRKAADDYLHWSRDWIAGVVRVLKPHGTFWLAIGDEYAAELKVLATRELGLHCRSWVVWFYTFGVHCTRKFTRSHAHIFQFVKDAKNFTFNHDDVRVPSARQLVYGDKRAAAGGRMPDDTWMTPAELPPDAMLHDGFVLRPQDLPDRFPPESDTWYFARVAGTFNERRGWHGCQMPEQLLGRIIRASSNPGETVLDPFGGSGTTLAVAKKLGRRFIGFELSESYAANIKTRLDAINVGDPLIGPERPEMSAPTTAKGRRLGAKSVARIPAYSRSVCQSPVVVQTNATLGQIAVANGELCTAIAEAYLASYQGFSADRVVADPELNDRFADSCRQLGMPGDVTDWNRSLLNLRKSSGLTAIPALRQTTIPAARLNQYKHASEMAWKAVTNSEMCSLDDILCNPDLGERFLRIARQLAPGFAAFEYRWAALKLRKLMGKVDKRYNEVRPRLRPAISLDPRVLPDCECLYRIMVNGADLFVGHAESLRACSFLSPDKIAVAGEKFEVRVSVPSDIEVEFREVTRRAGAKHLHEEIARANLVMRTNPPGNLPRRSRRRVHAA